MPLSSSKTCRMLCHGKCDQKMGRQKQGEKGTTHNKKSLLPSFGNAETICTSFSRAERAFYFYTFEGPYIHLLLFLQTLLYIDSSHFFPFSMSCLKFRGGTCPYALVDLHLACLVAPPERDIQPYISNGRFMSYC